MPLFFLPYCITKHTPFRPKLKNCRQPYIIEHEIIRNLFSQSDIEYYVTQNLPRALGWGRRHLSATRSIRLAIAYLIKQGSQPLLFDLLTLQIQSISGSFRDPTKGPAKRLQWIQKT